MINRISEFQQHTGKEESDSDFFTTIGRRISDRLREVKLESLAKDNPAVLLGLGLVVGLSLGWWVKRR